MSNFNSDSVPTSFAQARTANEIIKVQKSTVQLENLKETVVPRGQVLAHIFKIAMRQRNTWLGWVDECSEQLAGKFDLEVKVVRKILLDEVQAHLNELGDVKVVID